MPTPEFANIVDLGLFAVLAMLVVKELFGVVKMQLGKTNGTKTDPIYAEILDHQKSIRESTEEIKTTSATNEQILKQLLEEIMELRRNLNQMWREQHAGAAGND